MTERLKGMQILIVEDDYLIAMDHAEGLAEAGAEVIGPVGNLDAALATLNGSRELNFAVLDINLQGRKVYPVADALIARGIPFVFATGYDSSVIPERYQNVPRIDKPFALENLSNFLLMPADSGNAGELPSQDAS
jgi:CheY-like chemotaxis protein